MPNGDTFLHALAGGLGGFAKGLEFGQERRQQQEEEQRQRASTFVSGFAKALEMGGAEGGALIDIMCTSLNIEQSDPRCKTAKKFILGLDDEKRQDLADFYRGLGEPDPVGTAKTTLDIFSGDVAKAETFLTGFQEKEGERKAALLFSDVAGVAGKPEQEVDVAGGPATLKGGVRLPSPDPGTESETLIQTANQIAAIPGQADNPRIALLINQAAKLQPGLEELTGPAKDIFGLGLLRSRFESEGRGPNDPLMRAINGQLTRFAQPAVLEAILRNSGIDQEIASDVGSPAAVSPLGSDVQASGDFQTVARLIVTARRLILAGETTTANALLAQARFLAANSPEIQRSQELDEVIGDDLASELGVPIGTTLREVVDRFPRSPEEKAEERAAAAATGTGRVKAEREVALIGQGEQILTSLLEEIERDPQIVGFIAAPRRAGQTVLGMFAELGLETGTQLVEAAQNVAFIESELSVDQIFTFFQNPNLSVLDIIENSVGMILARVRTPQARVPVDIINKSIKDVKLTGLRTSAQVVRRLNFILELFRNTRQGLQGQFDLKGGQEQPGAPVFEFNEETGKFEQVE